MRHRSQAFQTRLCLESEVGECASEWARDCCAAVMTCVLARLEPRCAGFDLDAEWELLLLLRELEDGRRWWSSIGGDGILWWPMANGTWREKWWRVKGKLQLRLGNAKEENGESR
jgi:hypothetical protein